MENRIEPGLASPPGYAHTVTVEAGERLVFAAGAVPLDASGSLIGSGDLRAQTRACLDNLEEALRGAGTGLDRVVATTVYVVATEQADLVTVWDEVSHSDLSVGPHSATLLGVSFLGYAGQLVEITAVAVVPGD